MAADGEDLMILACTVFAGSTRVTDRRTDGRTELRWLRHAIAVPAVARKNVVFRLLDYYKYNKIIRRQQRPFPVILLHLYWQLCELHCSRRLRKLLKEALLQIDILLIRLISAFNTAL